MNEKITQQQIEACIYLFENAAIRRPELTQTLLNIYSAHFKCAKTYVAVANAVAENVDLFKNLVKNLEQIIKESIYLDNQWL